MTKHPYYYFLQANSLEDADANINRPNFDYQSEIWTKALTVTKYPGQERRTNIERDAKIPLSESLQDCSQRVEPLWEKDMVPRILNGTYSCV